MAALTIALIITNVMALVAYRGWSLGSTESVGVVVSVGFAVDYVVHLAAHYIHSKKQTRFERTRESLRDLGISVVSGAATTLLACGPLFICTLVIFGKFALFVICTISFSVFYSLCFFAAVSHICGPEGRCGDFGPLIQAIRDCPRRKKNE